MEEQKIIISVNLEQAVTQAVGEVAHDRLFVVCDRLTRDYCLPQISHIPCMKDASVIVLDEGDEHKTLHYVELVWTELQQRGATRHSLVVNLGGGMVTDLGGFAVSTFKRGLPFINIPTTLLAMVDASVGGKTGFNYGGLKNEIGVFRNAEAVILDTTFLHTLDQENILSGYAEMLKHGLISSSEMLAELLSFDVASLCPSPSVRLQAVGPCSAMKPEGASSLQRMVAESVAVKQRIVLEDPREQGLRKALNLGHTIGHAFEALALSQPARFRSPGGGPVLHGYAVAWGLVCELFLSVAKCGFPTDRMRQVVRFVFDHYGRMPITCDDYPTLLELMTHDKKNVARQINFTLLHDVGRLALNQTATTAEIEEALDFYREGA